MRGGWLFLCEIHHQSICRQVRAKWRGKLFKTKLKNVQQTAAHKHSLDADGPENQFCGFAFCLCVRGLILNKTARWKVSLSLHLFHCGACNFLTVTHEELYDLTQRLISNSTDSLRMMILSFLRSTIVRFLECGIFRSEFLSRAIHRVT